MRAKKRIWSAQARQLRRRLSGRLLASWALYTAVFAILAFICNATIVPRIADDVADATSTWHYLDRSDYPLSVCLDELNGALFATADSWENEQLLTQLESDVEKETQALSAQGLSRAEILAQTAVQDADLSNLSTLLNPMDSHGPLLVSINGETPAWTTLSKLQAQTVQKQIGYDSAPPEDWQFLETADTIEWRDLSTYAAIRAFKFPAAIALYLIGCIIVVFVGYGRSLAYFDELSRAVAGMLEDRTEPVKLSSQLRLTQDELNDIRLRSLADERAAKAAERRKDELVAYLAHDVRTPLTSVMGYLLLLDEAPDMPREARLRYIHTAAERSQRLEGLIDEFFEITRYNLQAIPIEREGVDVELLCQQVADEFFPDAEARGIHITVDAPSDVSAFVDPNKLARALGNVVRNAVAFANAGTAIRIQVQPDGNELVFSVMDQGREISPAHLESIFEKFYREDGARSSDSGRSGLGLAIAKEIVTAHGGTIAAQSAEGLTTFTIRIPQRRLGDSNPNVPGDYS